MKRFHFPLRPVAVLRAHHELRAREAFAVAVHAYVQTEEQLVRVRQQVAELAQLLAGHRAVTFLAAEAAALFRLYRAECQSEIAAERKVIEAREEMNRRRDEFLEAGRRLKIVHTLEDKARRRHRADTLRVEQAELDELAAARYSRRPVLT